MTQTYIATLIVHDCPTCGVTYGLDSRYENRKDAEGGSWRCPNGHSVHFMKSALQRAKESAAAESERADRADRAVKRERERRAVAEAERDAAQRGRAAARGQVTKMKNRIANGVCPVPGCRRSGFTKVKAHLASCHRDWWREHEAEVGA